MSKNCFYKYEGHKTELKDILAHKTKEEVKQRYDYFVMIVKNMESKKMHEKVPEAFQEMKQNLAKLSSLISHDPKRPDKFRDPIGARALSQTITGQLSAIRKQASLKRKKLSEQELALENYKAQLSELKKEAIQVMAKYQEETTFLKSILSLQQTIDKSEESTIKRELQTIRNQIDDYILNQESKKDVAKFLQNTLQNMNYEVDDVENVNLDGKPHLRLVAKNNGKGTGNPMASFEKEESEDLKELECEEDFEKAYSFSKKKSA